MSERVTLWHVPSEGTACSFVQLAENLFELRLERGDEVVHRASFADAHEMIAAAERLRAQLEPTMQGDTP